MLVPQISQSSLFPSLRNKNPPKQTSPFSGVFLTPLVPAALGSFPAASAAAAAAAIRASGMGSTSGDPSLYKQYCFGVTPQFLCLSAFFLFCYLHSKFLVPGTPPTVSISQTQVGLRFNQYVRFLNLKY